jgi:hypothetical protein
LKLNGLAFLYEISYCERSRLLIRSDQITNEKIPAFETAAMLIDRDSNVQGSMGIPAVSPF